MPKHILCIIDPISTLSIKTDTTLLLMQTALADGFIVSFCEISELYAVQEQAMAKVTFLNGIELDKQPCYQLGKTEAKALSEFDLILMRKDPPFNMHYIYATYLLTLAEKQGVIVSNSPKSLREFNEKLSILNFPKLIAPTLVTSSKKTIREFLKVHKDLILKPLDGMAGKDIFRVRENEVNADAIIEILTANEQTPIMAQRYIEAIREGDKRIWMINGKAFPQMLVRTPPPEQTRANLARGGKGVLQMLGTTEQKIADTLAPFLKANGIYFAGLDVIGDYLTEINITSPTGLRMLDARAQIEAARAILNPVVA